MSKILHFERVSEGMVGSLINRNPYIGFDEASVVFKVLRDYHLHIDKTANETPPRRYTLITGRINDIATDCLKELGFSVHKITEYRTAIFRYPVY